VDRAIGQLYRTFSSYLLSSFLLSEAAISHTILAKECLMRLFTIWSAALSSGQHVPLDYALFDLCKIYWPKGLCT